jgi:tricorn protease
MVWQPVSAEGTNTEEAMSNESHEGYYRFPTVSGDTIVFAAEDDLWRVPLAGGRAERLTTNLSSASMPVFSPDGNWIAFTGAEEGPMEVFVIPSKGGTARRVTYLGGQCRVVGWDGDKILFSSDYGLPPRQAAWIFRIQLDGTGMERLPYGPANRISTQDKRVVIGRKNREPAYWKRYRGGTAGEILIDRDGNGQFVRLVDLKSNLADPWFIQGRVYFVSDHEGIGNIYSVLPDGSDIRKHTNHTSFYARNASTDGKKMVYHCGADIWLLDTENGQNHKVDIEFHSSRVQTNRRFETAADFLESYDLSPDGAYLALVSRGKVFTLGSWDGPVLQQGPRQGAHSRLARYLNDGKRILYACDSGNVDHLEILDVTGTQPAKTLAPPDLGRPMDIKVSPKEDKVLVANHRNQLLLVDLTTGESKVIDQDEFRLIGGFNWSADGNWVAYGCSVDLRTSVIKVYGLESSQSLPVTRPVLIDSSPAFDPEGKYLYFLSRRIFNPVFDNLEFNAAFAMGMRPYAISLRKDVSSPFVIEPEGFGAKKDGEGGKKKDKEGESKEGEEKKADEKKDVKPLTIDFEGIEDRVTAFPVEEGIYLDLAAAKGRVFYTQFPVEGSIDVPMLDTTPQPKSKLKVYDFKKREETVLAEKVTDFNLSLEHSAVIYRSNKKLRVVAADSDKLEDKEDMTRKAGWIDLGRLRINIDPRAEWTQMLQEAWRLQRDYFWTEDMSQVDWKMILERYLPLVNRISSRSEFADLTWEMQGELGTSHCYEMGGDYRESPKYSQGFLGADLSYAAEKDAWRIDRIVRGDPWDPKNASPFLRPGTNMKAGMLLLGIGGQRVNRATSPHSLLVNLADQEIAVEVAEADGTSPRTVRIKTLSGEGGLRYRDWVEGNRQAVHEKSGGKLGYLHIPDMGVRGFAEFHRYFLPELDREGLVVDIRYNGGGFVAELLLDKLARKRMGYVSTRWMGINPYPGEAPMGPMVCLTNEFAGSNGDIFSQSFKLLHLGKLLGRRTWGGVVGIWPRNTLVDGTMTTQPEFSYWFQEMGWRVENYGVDPDIEIDILPQDWAAGKDPQIDRAIEEGLKAIEEHPGLKPDLSNRPNLRTP